MTEPNAQVPAEAAEHGKTPEAADSAPASNPTTANRSSAGVVNNTDASREGVVRKMIDRLAAGENQEDILKKSPNLRWAVEKATQTIDSMAPDSSAPSADVIANAVEQALNKRDAKEKVSRIDDLEIEDEKKAEFKLAYEANVSKGMTADEAFEFTAFKLGVSQEISETQISENRMRNAGNPPSSTISSAQRVKRTIKYSEYSKLPHEEYQELRKLVKSGEIQVIDG